MTSLRLEAEVKVAIENLGLHPVITGPGEIEIEENLNNKNYGPLKDVFPQRNDEIMTGRELALVEKIKSLVIEMVYNSDELPATKYSEYISKRLQVNYTYLSKLFSKARNITIEHFIIAHRIERVKQLLLFDELTLSEIACRLNYSSTAHLSAQFKKATGITPSIFKKIKSKNIVPVKHV